MEADPCDDFGCSCGKLFYKLKVIFIDLDDEELTGYLYVPDYMLEDHVPQAGDDMQGELWMTGYSG